MSTVVRGKIDRSLVQELGGLELGDLEKARGTPLEVQAGHRLERPIMQIPLEQIAGESPLQSRKTTFDPQVYPEDAELLASVKEHGVLEPVMVARDGASSGSPVYNLVFGHRRRAAAAMAGRSTIPAIVARGSEDLSLLTLAENTGGRQLSAFERAVAMTRLKEKRPNLTQTALAQQLGTSQGTISNLLAAYQGSSPALRGLFAEGMDARAVVELQETFAGLNEKEQVELAEQLRRASQQTVRRVKELVRSGVEPQAAAAVAGTRPGKAGDGGRPGLDEGERLKALAEQTGAPLRSVKALAGQAGKAGAGLEAVRLACVYVARGGGGQNIIETAQALAEDSKVHQLVMSRLQIDRRARRLIDGMEDEGRKAFASKVFFGGGGGT